MNSQNSFISPRQLLAVLLLLLAAAHQASAQPQGLRETFGPGVDGDAGGINLGSQMQRKTLDQDAFPLARCNDNSPSPTCRARSTSGR